jgi:hypothetical protein
MYLDESLLKESRGQLPKEFGKFEVNKTGFKLLAPIIKTAIY